MKNTWAPRLYKCLCGLITSHYVWSSDVGKMKVRCDCGKKLNSANLYEEDKQFTAIRTDTKNR